MEIGNIQEYKIYIHVKETYLGNDADEVDFRRHLLPDIALQKDVTFDQITMRPTLAEYSYNGQLLVKIKWTFEVDSANLMTRRIQEICYIKMDGTEGPWFIKEDQSFDINRQDQRNEMVRERETSRSALINDVKIVVLGMLQQTRPTENPYTLGGSLISTHSSSIDAFIQTGAATFKEAITSDTTLGFLDDVIAPNGTTIRMYILSRL